MPEFARLTGPSSQRAFNNYAGKQTVVVPAGTTEIYKLYFLPLRSGVFTGTVTFTAADSGQFVWYTLECRVADAPEIEAIDVTAAVRSAVEIDVPVKNPTCNRLVMKATYGHDCLVGPSSFSIEPEATEAFKFFFAPLIVGMYIRSSTSEHH